MSIGEVMLVFDNCLLYIEYLLEMFDLLFVEGKIVFVNFIVDWCIICKVNEWVVFDRLKVVSFFDEMGVVVVKGDWMNCDEEIVCML